MTNEPKHDDDLEFELPPPVELHKSRLAVVAAGTALVLAVAFFAGYLPRHRARIALEESTRASSRAPTRVDVVAPKVVSSDRPITLPGTVAPLQETVVYPRANGYVREWFVDIGDKVKEGQRLADIDTPELDQELAQARAQLAQTQATVLSAEASRDYSKLTLDRYTRMVPAGLASQQDLEQKQAQARVDEASVIVAKANVAAQQSNIRRLTQLQSFAGVVAPFAGTVTSRTVERGALVVAGNGTPLFKIAALDPVRVFVAVPQDLAPSVKVGVPVSVTIREFAIRKFEGTITRTSGELDLATRTLNTEIRVPNSDGALLAGMYAEASFTLAAPHLVLELPATALATDAKGQRVAVIGDDGKVTMVAVVLDRDTGPTILIASGINGSERVAKLGSASLLEGTIVEFAR